MVDADIGNPIFVLDNKRTITKNVVLGNRCVHIFYFLDLLKRQVRNKQATCRSPQKHIVGISKALHEVLRNASGKSPFTTSP